MKLAFSLFVTALTLSMFGVNAIVNDYGQSFSGYYDSFAQQYPNNAGVQQGIQNAQAQTSNIDGMARNNPQYGNPDYYNLPPYNQPQYNQPRNSPYTPEILPVVFPDQMQNQNQPQYQSQYQQPDYQQQYQQPEYQLPKWRPYRVTADAAKSGFSAGSPNIFVGGGTFAQQSAPTLLDRGGCYFAYGGSSKSLGNCEYLVKDPELQWIRSTNGIVEPGAVMYGSFPVGRARHTKGQFRVGKIIQDQGLSYPADRKENFVSVYDALVFRKRLYY